MTVEELIEKLEAAPRKKWVGILNKYSIELYSSALDSALKSVDRVLAEKKP